MFTSLHQLKTAQHTECLHFPLTVKAQSPQDMLGIKMWHRKICICLAFMADNNDTFQVLVWQIAKITTRIQQCCMTFPRCSYEKSWRLLLPTLLTDSMDALATTWMAQSQRMYLPNGGCCLNPSKPFQPKTHLACQNTFKDMYCLPTLLS